MRAFTYDRALKGRRIRLLKILPGDENSVLSIKVEETCLENAEFEALSYVWGSQTELVSIECNGKRLGIGVNLHTALHERRRRKSKGFLWADQICINQNSTEEKTHQVRLMSAIYARASKVIIWLGKLQTGDADGWALAETMYQKCNGHLFDPNVGVYDFHDFNCAAIGVPDPRFNPTWNALFRIISNSWFSRVWVIQELLMAPRSVMWRGALDIRTEVMLWLAMMIRRHRNLYESFDISMGSPYESALMAQNIAASYFDFKKRGPLPLPNTLARYLGMGAKVRKDRYFALAGVSSGLAKSFVDYNKTFEEVASLVGKMTLLGLPQYHLNKSGRVSLVLNGKLEEHTYPIEWLAFHANPKNHDLGIPSWVPDLLSPHSPGLLMTGFYNTIYLGTRYLPKPELRMDEKFQSLGTDRWRLRVPNYVDIKGAIFDHVRVIAKTRPRPPTMDPNKTNGYVDPFTALEGVAKYETEMVHWLSEIRLLADLSLTPRGDIIDGQSFDAFWRTLLYNRGPRFSERSPNQPADNTLAVSFGFWYLYKKFQMTRCWKSSFECWAFKKTILEKLAKPFEEAECKVRDARNFFVAKSGRIGWVPFRTQAGDQLCVFQGMRIPMVLRPHEDKWEIIGACYVHGLMDGEVWDLDYLHWEFLRFV